MQRVGSVDDAGGELVRSALVDAAYVLRRRWMVIVACTIVGGAVATALAQLATMQYTARAALLFRDAAPSPTAAQGLGGSSTASSTSTGNPLVDQATDVTLVSLATVARLTAMNVGNVSADQVRNDIGIAPSGSSNVVGITATTSNPTLSARLANAFSDQFVAFRQQIDSSALVAAEKQARQLLNQLTPRQLAGPTGRQLQSQAQTLSLEASLQSGNVEVVERAVTPTGASSPRKMRDAIFGLLAGLIVGMLAAVVGDRFDRRLRSVDEMVSLLGKPVLGTVPRSRGFDLKGHGPSVADLEAFYLLRASLQGVAGAGNADAMLVTSPQPGDGKSTVSLFLAMAAALPGTRVVLVDADLRRPGRYSAPVGLAQVLAGKAEIGEVITTATASVVGTKQEITFDVVPSGTLRQNPVELLHSDTLSDVIAYCRANYDFTVVDSPPATVVSDALLLAEVVPTVLVVARVGHTERPAFRQLVDRLSLGFSSNVIGLVANGVDQSVYGYSYAYTMQSEDRGSRGHDPSGPNTEPEAEAGDAEPVSRLRD